MTRVIHTGDTHVGYRQYHSPERQRDFLAALEAVVADAVDDDVDAVVHAGDLFHDRRPGLRDLQGTVATLRELRDADIPFLAVVGNHEGKRDGQWLDLFADLGLAERLDDEPRVVGDTAFYGLDFVPRSRRDDLEYEFAETDATHTALVAHGLFEPFAHGDWDTQRLLEEATVDFDALLLGDNHAPGTERVEDAWVTYCGSTERASASERADRGYNIVQFDPETSSDAGVGEGVAISRRGLETREFVFVDVELQPDEGTSRVREAVRQHDAEDAVVVVTLEGDGDPVTPAPVEELARDDGALVVRVNDHREVTADEDVDVSFADPDEAVRERVRELGLSKAARGIDETVRESKVADSNVRQTVEEHVAETVDDDDLDAFEGLEDDDEGEEAAEANEGEDASEDEPNATVTDGGDGATERPSGAAEDSNDRSPESTVGDRALDGAGEGDDTRDGDAGDSGAGEGGAGEGDREASGGEDQASMEEFL